MKNIALIIIASISVSACSMGTSLPEWVGDTNPNRHGYTSYDPCFRCGESWIFLPNAPQSSNDQAKLGKHGN
jgi:hypothetical protein|tara:strand:- start:166 stop:381 length:216 start_codon:yes stop_codon:yes gene_type:complete